MAYLPGSATLAAFTCTVVAAVITDGDLYRPALLMEPTVGVIDHVTAVLLGPETPAVNCMLAEAANVPDGGLIEIVVAGCSVTMAVADLDGSCRQVARTVTVAGVMIAVGAVYRPLVVMDPPDGLTLQVTPGSGAFNTRAVNWRVPETPTVTGVGETLMLVAIRVTVAVAVCKESAASTAVIRTVWFAETRAGAVYRPPALMAPTFGLTVQIAERELVNCAVSPAARVALAGDRLKVSRRSTVTTPPFTLDGIPSPSGLDATAVATSNAIWLVAGVAAPAGSAEN